MRRLLPLLLLLWCAVGVAWALWGGRDDGTEPSWVEAPEATDAPRGDGPGLLTRSVPAPAPVVARARRPLPPWLQKVVSVGQGEVAERFAAWALEDPQRLLDLAARHAPTNTRRPGSGAGRFWPRGRLFVGEHAGLRRALPALLAGLLGRADVTTEEKLYLLGMLAASEVLGESARPAVLLLVVDTRAPAGLRVAAAHTLLLISGPQADVSGPIGALLGDPTRAPVSSLRGLLVEIARHPAHARSLVPALRSFREQSPMASWIAGRAIFAEFVGTEDPARRLDLLGLALQSQDGTLRQWARTALLGEGDAGVDEALRQLSAAGGFARAEGVRFLLEKGVAAERLAPILIPALTDTQPRVRALAVKLLGRVVWDARDALPAIGDLLRGDDQTRWLSGVQALGALSTAAKGREEALRLLFAAVRLPSTKARRVAVQSLLMLDDQRARVVPLLADLLDDSEPAVRREAVDGLGELSAHDETARRHVQAALGDSDEVVRELARYWLEEDR